MFVIHREQWWFSDRRLTIALPTNVDDLRRDQRHDFNDTRDTAYPNDMFVVQFILLCHSLLPPSRFVHSSWVCRGWWGHAKR